MAYLDFDDIGGIKGAAPREPRGKAWGKAFGFGHKAPPLPVLGALGNGCKGGPDLPRPLEERLRSVLMESVHMTGGTFALSAWIKKRMGSEMQCLFGDNHFAIAIAAPKTAPGFLAALPQDGFTREEEILRQSIFNFLRSWESLESPTISDLAKFPEFQQARTRFLPKKVTIKSWIEQRIGGEIYIRPEGENRFVLEIAPDATQLVQTRFGISNIGKGPQHGRAPPLHDPRKGQPHPGEQKADKRYREAVQQAASDFVGGLPKDGLTPTEEELLEAIRMFMSGQAEKEVPLPDVMQDSTIRTCFNAVIPSRLRDSAATAETVMSRWVVDRINTEFRIFSLKKKFRMLIRAEDFESRSEEMEASKQEFFDSLPEDELLPEEEALREALLAVMKASLRKGHQPTVSLAGSDDGVRDARKALFPETAKRSFQAWITKRIGQDVGIMPGTSDPYLYFMEDGPPEVAADGTVAPPAKRQRRS